MWIFDKEPSQALFLDVLFSPPQVAMVDTSFVKGDLWCASSVE